MQTRTHDRSKTRQVVAAMAAFLVVSTLVFRASEAAFTAAYTNPDNSFATATISLASPSASTPLFGDPDGDPAAAVDAHGLYPGASVDGCIDVTYGGRLGAAELTAVTLDVEGAAGELADELTVSVERYDGPCADGGAGSVTVVAGQGLAGVAGASTGWTPAIDGETAGFAFTVTLDAGTEVGMGASATGIDLVWRLGTSG